MHAPCEYPTKTEDAYELRDIHISTSRRGSKHQESQRREQPECWCLHFACKYEKGFKSDAVASWQTRSWLYMHDPHDTGTRLRIPLKSIFMRKLFRGILKTVPDRIHDMQIFGTGLCFPPQTSTAASYRRAELSECKKLIKRWKYSVSIACRVLAGVLPSDRDRMNKYSDLFCLLSHFSECDKIMGDSRSK